MAGTIKYITLDNMSLFKDLMMDKVSAEDAKSIKTVGLSSDGKKLLFYKVSEPVGSTTPAYEIELPKQDLSNLLEKFNNATAGDIVIVNADGTTIADSGVKLESIATKAQVQTVETKVSENKSAIDAINNADTGILAQAKADATAKAQAVQNNLDILSNKVGNIPSGSNATTVVEYIDEKVTDITIGQEISDRVAQNEKDIATIKSDYLTSTDKASLEEKIKTAQDKADDALTHSQGVASNLAIAKKALEDADTAQVTRISDLEKKIVGLSGAMHFVGIKDSVPIDVTGFVEGDVIIVGEKEFVFNGTNFAEFGDATAQSQAISELAGRMDTAEGEIDTLQANVQTINNTLIAHGDRLTSLESTVNPIEVATEADIRAMFV